MSNTKDLRYLVVLIRKDGEIKYLHANKSVSHKRYYFTSGEEARYGLEEFMRKRFTWTGYIHVFKFGRLLQDIIRYPAEGKSNVKVSHGRSFLGV